MYDMTALVQQAMAQNGMSPQPTATPGSPSFNPATAPQAPMAPPQMSGSPIPSAPPMPKGQDEIIVGALIKQLERIDKQKQMESGVPPQM